MQPFQRTRYESSLDRTSPAHLPSGVTVWPLLVLESWDLARPMPRQAVPQPMGQSLLPDVLNWTWHEYGMRVGAARLLAIMRERGIPFSCPLNAEVCDRYPRLLEAALEAGAEPMGHGLRQVPAQLAEDERGMIAEALSRIERATNKKPLGWLGPGVAQTLATPDLLAEAGVGWFGDWVLDDEPVEVRTQSGELLALPYNLAVNDIVLMSAGHHEADYLFEAGAAYYATLSSEAARRGKVMSIALHPYLSGAPHRIAAVRRLFDFLRQQPDVAFRTGDAIAKIWRNGWAASAADPG